ncbi:MAG: hypothetical protein Q8O82_05925 [Pseudorhodobacter sp.]|nr:hypothetical protein [Pseudorhodobacter sp.]
MFTEFGEIGYVRLKVHEQAAEEVRRAERFSFRVGLMRFCSALPCLLVGHSPLQRASSRARLQAAIVRVKRARTRSMRDLDCARQQLTGFLLRHDCVFRAGGNWTKKHRVWLATLRFEHPAHLIVLQEYIDADDDAGHRLSRIEGQIRALIEGAWSYRAHAAVGAVHMARLEAVSKDIRDIAQDRRSSGSAPATAAWWLSSTG